MFHLFPDFYCFTNNDKCLHAALEKLLGCGVDTISALRDVAQWFPSVHFCRSCREGRFFPTLTATWHCVDYNFGYL